MAGYARIRSRPIRLAFPCWCRDRLLRDEVVQYLVSMLRSQKRVEVHGIVYDGYLPCLRLLTATEEKGLKKLVK